MLETAFNIDTSSIKFGSGVTQEILYEINRLSISKLLIITDRNVIDLPVSKFVTDELSKSKISFEIYSDVEIDPTNESFMDVLEFSKNRLDKKGTVVSKFFMGEEFEEIKIISKKYFKKIDFFKPDSSRDESRETYIHCSELST